MEATRDDLVGASVHEIEPNDVVVLDAIYGMERVISVDRHTIDNPAIKWEAIRLQLRTRYGDSRYALRFPHEPCVKVETRKALVGETSTLPVPEGPSPMKTQS